MVHKNPQNLMSLQKSKRAFYLQTKQPQIYKNTTNNLSTNKL